MRKGSISIILLMLLVVFTIFSVATFSILKNTENIYFRKLKEENVEFIANNLLEFSIATVKMGMDNSSNLREDIFLFKDYSQEVAYIKNVKWPTQTKQFIEKKVDTKKATIIFSNTKKLSTSSFEKLSLKDYYKEFKKYIESFPNLSVFSAVYKIENSGKYLLYVRIKNENTEFNKIAIFTSEKLNKYIYYSQEEPLIYFTSNEIIYGPLKSNDYIHVYQYAKTNKKFTVFGTLEVPGIKYYNENNDTLTTYDSQHNPEMVYDLLKLKGNPPVKFVDSDIGFTDIYEDYSSATSKLALPLEDFLYTSTECGIKLPNSAIITSKVVDGENILTIYTNGKSYELSWKVGELPKARIRYNGKSNNVKFNGVITSDYDIELTDNKSLQKRLFTYDGNLTIFSKSNIYINTRIVPYKTLSNVSFDLNKEISLEKAEEIKNFVLNNEDSSLDLVAKNDVIVKSNKNFSRINNHKIFANIYSFNGSFRVEDYQNGQKNKQLFIFGSIMQRKRGPVGLVGQYAPGYYKFYVHDSRALLGRIGTNATPSKKQSIMILYLENVINRG
ncbi:MULTISPECIES: hypothetical protein [unclassified Thermosipho (in: thermotogales)]|uniref:hypothetical protein n=1 Tax=unclassified Thermosipho (in: thermotogales) TaxID=2676525 RepID=UPI000984589A|nr:MULTISPECIES: hypothetical protein [unclassified Thermosipho (in: thermotogales)]MBT1247282.1 hypothetical protein [Thermosipho sp. 1244]OOC47137.1 hypothetical protein XO09_02965 [Thermosipho sp. 1223]